MNTTRTSAVTALGLSCTAIGVWLRLKAYDLAWPVEWGYSGPRQDTIWAIQERAYQDLSLAALGFGLALILLVVASWLWVSRTEKQERQV